AFAPVAFAFSTAVAGTLAGEILRRGPPGHRFSHAGTIALAALGAVLLFAGPLLAFAGPLHRARLRGILRYGALAGAVGRRFGPRWTRHPAHVGAGSLEAPDFSATTDLYAIAANVRELALVPVGAKDLAALLGAALLPFVPLVFLVMPLSALLKR